MNIRLYILYIRYYFVDTSVLEGRNITVAGHILREIEAMDSLSAILLPLTQDECRRVLMWAEARFAGSDEAQTSLSAGTATDASASPVVAASQAPAIPVSPSLYEDYSFEDDEDAEADASETADDAGTYTDLSSFLAAVSPKTAIQKVATCAWWLEEQEGLPTWRTFDVTKSMKLMGKPMKYLSTTISQERGKDIPLVEQVSKGEGQQGHGEYRLTEAGRTYINERLKLAQ